jgi:hypothetical protein
MEERPELLRSGPGAALYAIVDRVVDDYQPVIDALDAQIRAVEEEEVFSPERSNPVERIYTLKRDVLELDAAVAPLVDPLDRLARDGHPLIHEDLQTYFRDAHDHLLRAVREVAGFRDLLTSVLTANLTQVGVRQNEDVRKISAWAAIIAVPTAIAGIYGMNFEQMPELGWTLGYPLVMAVIAVVCASLYVLPPRRLALAATRVQIPKLIPNAALLPRQVPDLDVRVLDSDTWLDEEAQGRPVGRPLDVRAHVRRPPLLRRRRGRDPTTRRVRREHQGRLREERRAAGDRPRAPPCVPLPRAARALQAQHVRP